MLSHGLHVLSTVAPYFPTEHYLTHYVPSKKLPVGQVKQLVVSLPEHVAQVEAHY